MANKKELGKVIICLEVSVIHRHCSLSTQLKLHWTHPHGKFTVLLYYHITYNTLTIGYALFETCVRVVLIIFLCTLLCNTIIYVLHFICATLNNIEELTFKELLRHTLSWPHV